MSPSAQLGGRAALDLPSNRFSVSLIGDFGRICQVFEGGVPPLFGQRGTRGTGTVRRSDTANVCRNPAMRVASASNAYPVSIKSANLACGIRIEVVFRTYS